MKTIIVEAGIMLTRVNLGQPFEFCDAPGPKYLRVRCGVNKFSTTLIGGEQSAHGNNDEPPEFGNSRISLANDGRHDGCWCYIVRVSDGELGSAHPQDRVIPYDGELQLTRIFEVDP